MSFSISASGLTLSTAVTRTASGKKIAVVTSTRAVVMSVPRIASGAEPVYCGTFREPRRAGSRERPVVTTTGRSRDPARLRSLSLLPARRHQFLQFADPDVAEADRRAVVHR